MSLYYEASDIISKGIRSQSALKHAIYDNKKLKSTPVTLFALVSEAIKWSEVLSDVIQKSALLNTERRVMSSVREHANRLLTVRS